MQTRFGPGVVVVAVGLSVVLVGVLGGGIGTVGGAEDSGPLADAGLDQTTTEGSTVYLDAGGSTAPDGRIVAYEWSIETPSGTTIDPECPTCVTTSFVANESGTYEVSVEVTDAEGRTDSDTLYVEAKAYDPPEVSVTGPSEVSVGESATYTAQATATEEPLSSLLWRQDGRYHADASFGDVLAATEETTVTFGQPGVYEINATVADELGYQASDGMTVRVTSPNPYFAVTITDIDSPVQAGEELTVTATVENVGDGAATQTVTLAREGTTMERWEVSLAPGAEQTLSFTWDTTTADTGMHEFVAQTANETDSRQGMVRSGSPGPGGVLCGGASLIDCAIELGKLDAKITQLSGNLAQVDLELVLPHELKAVLDLEDIDLDPANHDVTIDGGGEELDVNPDGTINMREMNADEADVEMEFGDTVSTDSGGPIEIRAAHGETKQDEVNPGDYDIDTPTVNPSPDPSPTVPGTDPTVTPDPCQRDFCNIDPTDSGGRSLIALAFFAGPFLFGASRLGNRD
jgi:hypothetical protein